MELLEILCVLKGGIEAGNPGPSGEADVEPTKFQDNGIYHLFPHSAGPSCHSLFPRSLVAVSAKIGDGFLHFSVMIVLLAG